MKSFAAAGVIGAGLLVTAVDAAEIYEYSTIAYWDAERTDEAFRVTATFENDIDNMYVGWGYRGGFRTVDIEIDVAEDDGSVPLGNVAHAWLTQYNGPIDGQAGNPWDEHGYEFAIMRNANSWWMKLHGFLDPFEDPYNDVQELRSFTDVLGTGEIKFPGQRIDFYTVASLAPTVPGPGAGMVVGLAGFAIGHRRRRR